MNEAAQTKAIANLPAELAILKLENDTIQSLAAARPRNHESIKQEIIAQFEAYPAFAAQAIYCKPVGKDASGKMKYARGLSIRAAEAIAEAYGYNRVRVDAIVIDEDTVKIEATFTDYQKGRIWQDGGLVSRFYKSRYGKREAYAQDRFYDVVVKAAKSRAVREVITRSVPPGLRAELFEMAEKRTAQLLTDEKVESIIEKFAGKRITLEQLEARVGRTRKMGWTERDRLDLLGLWTGLDDGETTLEEAFGDLTPAGTEKATAGPTAATGAVTGEDLASAGPPIRRATAAKDAPTGPATDPMYESVGRELLHCHQKSGVKLIRDLYCGPTSEATGEQQAVIRTMCDDRDAAIAAGRGERANAKAKA